MKKLKLKQNIKEILTDTAMLILFIAYLYISFLVLGV